MPRPKSAPCTINPALRAKLSRLRALFARANADEVATRYEIGAIISEVRASKKHGEHSVDLLADELGQNRSTLYRYAAVATTWTKKELRALTKSDAVSWSHLIELARVRSKRERDRLVREVVRERLSVRDLMERTEPTVTPIYLAPHHGDVPVRSTHHVQVMIREPVRTRVQATFTHHDADDTGGAPYSAAAVVSELREVTSACHAFAEHVNNLHDAIIADAMQGAVESDEDLVGLLDQAATESARLEQLARESREKLERLKARIERAVGLSRRSDD